MDIPINADVYCTDGACGHSIEIVLNPVTEQVTHLVVKERTPPHTERLVPIEKVTEATPERIQLGCAQEDLATMDPFVKTEFIRTTIPHYRDVSAGYAMPYVVPEGETVEVRTVYESVPPGELGIRRGARVVAVDGQIGRVDEFMINPKNGHITHLVMREGHLWGTRDVTIPVSAIERVDQNLVYLKQSKRQIEALPVIPVRRWWEL